VGGITQIADEMGIPVLIVVGSVDARMQPRDLEVLSLVDLVGEDVARREPKRAVEQVVADWLSARS
jgi:hypothetical protein